MANPPTVCNKECPDISHSPRRRGELIAVGFFVAVSLLVPILTTEMCPFSRAPMFADSPRHYCTYHVFDPQGQRLDALAFGLQRNYWGNPLGVGVGYRPPNSVDTFGQVASEEEVRAGVQKKLADKPELPYVEVVQEVIGATNEHQVGVMRELRWRVGRQQ